MKQQPLTPMPTTLAGIKADLDELRPWYGYSQNLRDMEPRIIYGTWLHHPECRSRYFHASENFRRPVIRMKQ